MSMEIGVPVPAGARLFIDTDMGVDDAVAVAWLLRQPEARIVGFSTVFGNAAVEHTTANLLTLLDAAGRRIPVAIGAAAPLVFAHNCVGALVHGPDGFWFAQTPHDLSELPRDAPAAIAAAARRHPGLTILALGPLTNIARALQEHPADFGDARLIALCGAKRGGNISPIAEFNAFADPHALESVLAGPLRVELVMLDAFEQVQVLDSDHFVAQLDAAGGTVGQLLARVLAPYVQANTLGAGGPIGIPDAAAAIYALRPEFGASTSALVHVIAEAGVARGQTIVADRLTDRVALIAGAEGIVDLAERAFTPGFDMQREIGSILRLRPDNAHVVLDVAGQEMVRLLERALTGQETQVRTIGA
jgi:inosine-uridine nucleoside N-ribohydrolase